MTRTMTRTMTRSARILTALAGALLAALTCGRVAHGQATTAPLVVQLTPRVDAALAGFAGADFVVTRYEWRRGGPLAADTVRVLAVAPAILETLHEADGTPRPILRVRALCAIEWETRAWEAMIGRAWYGVRCGPGEAVGRRRLD